MGRCLDTDSHPMMTDTLDFLQSDPTNNIRLIAVGKKAPPQAAPMRARKCSNDGGRSRSFCGTYVII